MAPKTKPEQPPEPQPQPIPLRDDPYAPMIYCTELAGGGQQGENYNLTFAALMYDHGDGTTKAYRKTNLRLVIPRIAIPAMIGFLQQLQAAADGNKPAAKETTGSRTIQ